MPSSTLGSRQTNATKVASNAPSWPTTCATFAGLTAPALIATIEGTHGRVELR
jgi:hypothetical protein